MIARLICLLFGHPIPNFNFGSKTVIRHLPQRREVSDYNIKTYKELNELLK
jgi:hypothetical protein